MRPAARASLLALATLLATSRGVRAQCSGGNVSRFDAFTVTPTALTLPSADATTFDAGASVASYSITVDPRRNNVRWYLCAISLSVDMGTAPGYTKPLSDLQWSLDGSTWTSFSALSLQPITNNRGRRTFTIYVRSLLSYANDVPAGTGAAATYGATLSFRVSM